MKRQQEYACVRTLGRIARLGLAWIVLGGAPLGAQTFSSGSTGEDGPFNPSCSPTPCTVTEVLPESGVFNFTTIDVPAGVTVEFTQNSANTPVTLLATEDVNIVGAVVVSGQDAGVAGIPGRGGPGGFHGGRGGSEATGSRDGSPGSGPGGGGGGFEGAGNTVGSGGGFGEPGQGPRGGATYGVTTLLPLIGGSGGGGGRPANPTSAGGGGGGGGGAILIASSGTITITGAVRGNGGIRTAVVNSASGAGGSGGGIRLVANGIAGNGRITAEGAGSRGGDGRIRLEAFDIDLSGDIDPPPTTSLPGPVTPPTGFPTLVITAVGGVSAPANPLGSFLAPPDIALSPAVTNPVTIEMAASNVPVGTVLDVKITSEAGEPTTVTSTPLAGSDANSTATASADLTNGVNVLTAAATFATAVSPLGGAMMLNGERVKQIRVAATYGEASTVTYITESGREVEIR